MKRYLTIKNFRNINPVIINEDASEKEKEDEVKYGRLYLNGDVEQGGLISIIGANGTGKSNILSAIEKAFKGGIDDKRDNPKIDGFIGCKPELEIFIESYRGNIYKGKFLKDGLMFYPYKVNNTYFLKNYLETIAKLIFEEDKLLENRYYEITYRTHVSEDNISIMLKIFMELKNKFNNYVLSYFMIISIFSCLSDIKYYKKTNARYEFDIDKAADDIENNKVQLSIAYHQIIKKVMQIEQILDYGYCNVYVHNKSNIKNEELTINKDDIKNSSFLYSLFKSTNNMKTYEYLINNYDYIVSDVSFSKQKENEINKLFEDTISKSFNELYKSNNDYVFKIILETNCIRVYFETKNGLTNLENESDGFNWFFSLFFNTINPNELKKGDIIIIDEPEQHLSVPLIKELRKFLKQFAKDNGITIITSIQIPYFADINHLDELKIVEQKQDGVGVKIENDFSATYGKVDSLEKIINAFGVKHIDITRDTRIIYVEGITDYNYLTAFKLLMEHIENKEINIAFMPINGVGRPNDERQKKDIIDSLCQLSKNPILLIDGDNSADQFAELAENTSLRITQLKGINPNFITIEDLFGDKDKRDYKINKNNKDALASALFKNNIINYYEKKLITETTINNFFKVIREID
ncbi:AAA family ATPase [Brachyspira pilosicoli]|uniref:AAA family ATPase n=1 Tax=Brachyspira pilosicoli TaxID=52584 RepID=UPI003004F41E